MIGMKFDLPYIKRDRDRYGVTRYYFRRRGQKPVRLTGEPGTAAFIMQYDAARPVPPQQS